MLVKTPRDSPLSEQNITVTVPFSEGLRSTSSAMASPTAISHPIPRRTHEEPEVDLRHPTPDLQTLQGAYVGNIERLEEHAERLSEAGSDIGEEIRKLQLEQKLSDSRRSSLLSAVHADEPARHFTTRSRNASTGSYTNSIVDVNGQARWGGYSPTAYITSPAGSLASGSFTQRQRSGSRASRLGQVVHAEDHDEMPSSIPPPARSNSPPPAPAPAPGQRSVSSFTKQYEQITQEIHDGLYRGNGQEFKGNGQEFRGNGQEFKGNGQEFKGNGQEFKGNGQEFKGNGREQHPESVQQEQFDDPHYPAPHDLPDRPETAASTDTTHQARTLWQDFDGVHCPNTVEEEPEPSQASGSRNSSFQRMESELPLPPLGAPPPDDGMVFYPAPVPKMLNLPKRLSQQPAVNVQARRRTQILESMNVENRKSAPWLSDAGVDKQNRKSIPIDPRKSRQSLANLPPQLRASAYFDQLGPAQEFEVKGASAEDTLNSILEASAHAPVSAFTDHPFSGHVGDEVYGKENKRFSKVNELDKAETRKSRSSLNLLDTRRNSSGELLNKLKKRNSSADLNMLTIRAAESRMSLGAELDDPDREAQGPQRGDHVTPAEGSVDDEHIAHPDDEIEGKEDEEVEEEPEEHYYGPPTTLLAELQMRKQQQKTRNMTAATAYPNGMHATLLELDAVAEIEKNKRKGQKVNLAWEAQQLHGDEDDSDDDVPLGVLFPGRDGPINKRAGASQQRPSNWDQPLGLIAQRAMEDNEPLSRRRNRLVGMDPNRKRDQSPEKSQSYLAVPTTTTPGPESEEDEGETLAQRIRRLKNRQALDNALGTDIRKSTVSGEFAAEMMSQFGVTEEEEEKPKAAPSPGLEEEETLGQRRARLQAEAMATRPPMRGSMSMADILAAHPIDNTNQAHKVTDEMLLASMPQNSLLHKNAKKQDRLKADRMEQTRRISSFGSLEQPLVGNLGQKTEDQPIAAKIQAFKNQMAGSYTPNTGSASRVPPTMFNGQLMGGMTPATSTMNLPGQPDGYFAQANMGMAPPYIGMNNGMGMQPNGYGMSTPNLNMMQPQIMPMNMGMMGMPGMPGMPGSYPYSPMAGGMGGQPPMMNVPGYGPMTALQIQNMEPPMDPRQRDMIDRWRQGLMH
jgi:hypothetical protein